MRFFISAAILFTISTGLKSIAQNYGQINFGWEQGFKAATAYNVYQDSKGYIWAGTENGLMRYNGYEFRSFTTQNGLPDNEIIKMYEDRSGRLWLLPFAKAVCYYKNGKIYNQQNDSYLKNLDLDERPENLFQDRYGIIWVYLVSGKLISLKKNGQAVKLKEIDGNTIYTISVGEDGLLNAYTAGGRLYRFSDDRFTLFAQTPFKEKDAAFFSKHAVYIRSAHSLWRYSYDSSKKKIDWITLPVAPIWHELGFTDNKDGTAFIGSDNGGYILSSATGKLSGPFLAGSRLGLSLKASDGSYWIATFGNGISRLFETPVKTLQLPKSTGPVNFIRAGGQYIQATTFNGNFITATCRPDNAYDLDVQTMSGEEPFDHYAFVMQELSGKWIICCTHGISLKGKLDDPLTNWFRSFSSKQAIVEDSSHLLVAGTTGVFRLDTRNFSLSDTFFYSQRTTAVAKIGTTIYAGTLNGLIASNSVISGFRAFPHISLLQKRITAICSDSDGILWCANGDAELIGIKKDNKVIQIGHKEGLQCNRISSLKASERFIWIGTDNGLFAIMSEPPYSVVRHITFANGLSSNQVNCLDIYQKRVWVGTVGGINYFDEDNFFKLQESRKIIINAITNGSNYLEPTPGALELKSSSLTLDFDIVDFSGGASPKFEYRLNERDKWIPLESKQLYFPSLPPGSFQIALKASSPNWPKGVVFSQQFYHPPPYYRRSWFVFICLLAGVLAGILIITALVKWFRRKDRKQLAIQQNLLRLEQMALQGQMNPHFIFNCIASIKHYYNGGDRRKADNFVDAFSGLIRQTFEMSAETFVPLDKEIGYLEQYLKVEQQRFSNTFDFRIIKQTGLSGSDIAIPAMLLQPIVENAIRHGIRHLPDGKGQLDIIINQEGSSVRVIVADNGVGRQKSREINAGKAIHLVNSTTVNEKRIHILNRLFSGKIHMHIEDRIGSNGESEGTRVIITYPAGLFQLAKNESNNR